MFKRITGSFWGLKFNKNDFSRDWQTPHLVQTIHSTRFYSFDLNN